MITYAKTRGFTLIELLTVIAIIGILAAILIPVVAAVRESARSALCVANLRDLSFSMNLFVDENDGLIEVWLSGTGPEGTMWAEQLERGGYLTSRETLYCPSAHPYDAYTVDTSSGVPWAWRTYGLNLIRSPRDEPTVITHWGNLARFFANQVENPSRHFLFADSFMTGNSSQRFRISSFEARPSWDGVHIRHKGRANMVFLDGHVESFDAPGLARKGFTSIVDEDKQIVNVNP